MTVVKFPDPEPVILSPEFSEDALALEFTARHKHELRYCAQWGTWLGWDGTRWKSEKTLRAFDLARAVARDFANLAKSKKIADAKTVAAIERLARSDRRHAATVDIWDADPWLLNTPGGMVDLHTGTLLPHDPERYITKITAVAPADQLDCPLWLKFLHDATGGDKELIRFLRQWAGYCLTGDTREHALLFAYGPGGNGKTVWLNTMAGILADYAKNAPMETFAASQSDRHPTDLAMLKGARMVCASETEEERAWAEVRIKQLTGGDTIAARFMRQDFFEYRPQFKLTVIGNHKPVLRNVGEAERRRFNVVPFTRKPARPDKELETKLKAEWPAILRWMIEGCLDWQQNGLTRPQIVIAATETYFSEQDTLRHWLEDSCETGPHTSDTQAVLFKSWTDYAIAAGEKPGTKKSFTQTMHDRYGFEPVKHTPGSNAKRGFLGVQVRPADTSSQWQNRRDD
jgi:putative DNA primase/helicase